MPQASQLTEHDIEFTDSHCHIQEASYPDSEGAYQRAIESGITRMICASDTVESSAEAVEFARLHPHAWAMVGIHPHEALAQGARIDEIEELITKEPLSSSKIVAMGEIGLDYFYDHSPREQQILCLEVQIDMALRYNLPISFHVREAFADFWPIFDNFRGVMGVVHSFTDDTHNLEKALERGLWIGVNGIATFARDKQAVYQSVPLSKLLLETDAPYLTPSPYRGKVNEPALIQNVAQHIVNLQSINLQKLSQTTQHSAMNLFHLK